MLMPIEQQKAEEGKATVAEINNKYVDILGKRKAELDAEVSKAEADVATLSGIEKDNAVIALKDAKRVRADGLAEVKAKQNAEVDDAIFRSKVFAAYINGHACITSLDINKKIIKGLGAQLFLSHYRFEVPHDAYSADEKGIKAKAEEIIDYGKEKFVKCVLHNNYIYVKVDEVPEIGKELSLHIDVEKSRIYENMFDIRLY